MSVKRKTNAPRKATRDTHISGYTLPVFETVTWKTLEKAAGIKLNKNARERIRELSNIYTEEKLSRLDGAQRLELLGRKGKNDQLKNATELTRLQKALKDANLAWIKARKNETLSKILLDYEAEIKVRSHEKVKFTQSMLALETISITLAMFLKNMQSNAAPVRKSAQHKQKAFIDPFTEYVSLLARLVQENGGKISKTTMTVNSKSMPSFARFIKSLNETLPPEVRKGASSDHAFSKEISRILKKSGF